MTPFVYTRTKYFDYQVITSSLLTHLPLDVKTFFIDVSRRLIDVENECLMTPTCFLIRHRGYLFWGIAVMNSYLGDNNRDKSGRPVRGVFAMISEKPLKRITYSQSWFRSLYKMTVDCVWESLTQEELSDIEFSGDMGNEDMLVANESISINTVPGAVRFFPHEYDATSILTSALAKDSDISVVTNAQSRSQCIGIGKTDFCFMNAVLAGEVDIDNIENITYNVNKNVNNRHEKYNIEAQTDENPQSDNTEETPDSIYSLTKIMVWIMVGITVIMGILYVCLTWSHGGEPSETVTREMNQSVEFNH